MTLHHCAVFLFEHRAMLARQSCREIEAETLFRWWGGALLRTLPLLGPPRRRARKSVVWDEMNLQHCEVRK